MISVSVFALYSTGTPFGYCVEGGVGEVELFSQQRVDHLIESIAFEVEATNFVIVSFIKLIH